MKRLDSFCQRNDQCAYDQESAWLILAQAYLQNWLVRRDYAAGVAWLRHAAERCGAAAKGLLQDLGEPT